MSESTRKAFELWASEGLNPQYAHTYFRRLGDEYECRDMQSLWDAWQAGSAHALLLHEPIQPE